MKERAKANIYVLLEYIILILFMIVIIKLT